MAATEIEVKEVPPPVTVVGPLAWLRKNLFSTWYNALFTVLILWLAYALLRPAYEWATTEARWGVIEGIDSPGIDCTMPEAASAVANPKPRLPRSSGVRTVAVDS